MTDHYPPMKRCSDCDQPFEEDTGNRLCPDCNREYDRLEGTMTDTAAAVEHTPGPWEMLIPSEDVPDSGIIQTVEGRVLVAVAALSGFSFEERAANARLIAAAPAMLAALEAIADMVVGAETDHAQLSALCIALARIARAQARGVQE